MIPNEQDAVEIPTEHDAGQIPTEQNAEEIPTEHDAGVIPTEQRELTEGIPGEGSFIAAIYGTKWYVGKVTEKKKKKLVTTFMKPFHGISSEFTMSFD